MGLTPGPLYKQLLAALEDEVLEGRCNTKEEAVKFVEKRLPR
jgi:hypothetical protein